MGAEEVIAYAQALLLDGGDADYLPMAYAEARRQLAAATEAFVGLDVLAVTAGRGRFALPARTLSVWAVLSYPRQLERTSGAALDTWNPAWPTLTGTPRHWTPDREATDYVRVVPAPTTAPAALGLPFADGYPGSLLTSGMLVAIGPSDPEEDQLDWPFLDGLLGLRAAALEARRLGEDSTPPLADALDQLAAALERVLLPPPLGMAVKT